MYVVCEMYVYGKRNKQVNLLQLLILEIACRCLMLTRKGRRKASLHSEETSHWLWGVSLLLIVVMLLLLLWRQTGYVKITTLCYEPWKVQATLDETWWNVLFCVHLVYRCNMPFVTQYHQEYLQVLTEWSMDSVWFSE